MPSTADATARPVTTACASWLLVNGPGRSRYRVSAPSLERPTWTGIPNIARVPASTAEAVRPGHRRWAGPERSTSTTGRPVSYASTPGPCPSVNCNVPSAALVAFELPTGPRGTPPDHSASPADVIEVSWAEAQQSIAMSGTRCACCELDGGPMVSPLTAVPAQTSATLTGHRRAPGDRHGATRRGSRPSTEDTTGCDPVGGHDSMEQVLSAKHNKPSLSTDPSADEPVLQVRSKRTARSVGVALDSPCGPRRTPTERRETRNGLDPVAPRAVVWSAIPRRYLDMTRHRPPTCRQQERWSVPGPVGDVG